MSDVTINSLKSLMIFKTLYETGTATRTAKDLGITQSGVSRSLANLEESIQLTLFTRDKNRLTATPEADELYKEIRKLLSNLDEMKLSITELRQFGCARLRLASSTTLGASWVPDLIANLLAINANYSIVVDTLDTADIVRALEADQFDAGFVTLPVNSQVLNVETLFSLDAVCLLHCNHPLVQTEAVHIEDLQDQHLIMPVRPDIGADHLSMMLSQFNVSPSGITEANVISFAQLVARGVGVAIMNPLTAAQASTEHTVIRPFNPGYSYSFGLAYKPHWQHSKMLQTLKANLPTLPAGAVPAS